MIQHGAARDVGRQRRLLTTLATAVALLVAGVASPPGASAAVGVPVTYLDHTYSASVDRPSEDKPQSKLWFTGGSWWALMVNSGGSVVYIHELMPDHTWRNTGVQVDTRVNSTGDALWNADDNSLYVASRAIGSDLQVNKFSYDPTSRSWATAAGFPVSVDSGGGSESATIDRDSRGILWVTYTRASRVWVAHATNTSGTAWTAGFQPAVPDTVIKADDLSSVIAYGNNIGILWSDQESGAFRFAIHEDGDPDSAWRAESALVGPYLADDHLNLKQLVGDPQGRIYAAIKTSANDSATASPSDPLVGVLTRTPTADGGGSWSFAPAGTVADDHTRPLIMIDSTNQELYLFATAPGQGGDIFYKKAPLSNIQFGPGRGTPFVDAAPVVNNATGAKDPVTAQSSLVILASAEGQKRYVHAEMQLAGGSGGGDTTPPTATTDPAAGATGIAVAANVSATFSETVQGVSGTTFTLVNNAIGAAVNAAVSYDATSHVATLDPAADLAAGTRYTATLTGGTSAIRDVANNPLATTAWTFTTATSGDSVPPTVTARTPAVNRTGVGRTANVTATFSEAVQNVTATTFTLRNTATGASVSAVVSRSSTTNRWVLNPGVTLAAKTRYTVTITGGANGVKDNAGNPLSLDVTWSFTSGA